MKLEKKLLLSVLLSVARISITFEQSGAFMSSYVVSSFYTINHRWLHGRN
jgi:hypothetical protein